MSDRMADQMSELVAAIERGRLGAADQRLVATFGGGQVGETARAIALAVTAEQRTVVDALALAGIDATPNEVAARCQRHDFVISVDRAEAPRAAAIVAQQLGYRRHPDWRGGADRSFWATAHEIALTRSDAATFVARLRWATPAPKGLVSRLFRPTPADWAAIRLPSWAWRAYSLVRPFRLLRERVTTAPDHASLEPFLATPSSLIGPLLDLAEVTSDDVVADIGCGDGRIVVTAAERHGCRAIGFEYDPDLAAAAERRVEAAGLGGRVRIEQGDGLAADLGEVTVAMLFVPATVAARAVPDLLQRLRPGARIVVHEQSALPAGLPQPDRTEPVVTPDAVTIARRWTVRSH